MVCLRSGRKLGRPGSSPTKSGSSTVTQTIKKAKTTKTLKVSNKPKTTDKNPSKEKVKLKWPKRLGVAPVDDELTCPRDDAFDPCWIVTLKQDLPTRTCKAHLKKVETACHERFDEENRPAAITQILRSPLTGNITEMCTYTGYFPHDVIEIIKKTKEFHSIEPNRLIPVEAPSDPNYNLTTSPTGARWLDQISNPGLAYDARAMVPDAQKPKVPWLHRGIASRGAGACIVILDTGLEPVAVGTTDRWGLPRDRFEFYDVAKAVARRRQILSNRFGPWPVPRVGDEGYMALWTIANDQTVWDNHQLIDSSATRESWHGTNVTLLAASDSHGAASDALIINYNVAAERYPVLDPQTGQPTPMFLETSRMVEALCHFRNLAPPEVLRRTVINCSFGDKYDPLSGPGAYKEAMNNDLETMHTRDGVHIVGSAGNEGIRWALGYPVRDTPRPSLLRFAFCASSLQSYYVPAQKTDRIPGNMVNNIWVLGEDLEVWHPTNTKKRASGTSYASAILSGVLACVLAEQAGNPNADGRLSFMDLRQQLEVFLEEQWHFMLHSYKCLRYSHKPDVIARPMA